MRRAWFASASKAALIVVALVDCSSPEPPSMGGSVGAAGAVSTPGASAAGQSGGGAGKTASSSAGAGSAAVSGSAAPAGRAAIGGSPSSAAGGTPAAGVAGEAASASMGVAGAGGAAGGIAAAGAGGSSSAPQADCTIAPISDDMRDQYEAMNDPYYTKYASANGVIVATGAKVGDEAVTRYCHLLSEMFSNDKIHKSVIAQKMWFTMISQSEQLSSLPQINKQYGTSLNQRARGLGSLTPTICAEDSIMCMKGDPWNGDCICPHETGHTLYSDGIMQVPELSKRLTDITNSVRSSGRLSNAYVWMDGDESGMMSWGTQAWYNCAINGTQGQYHTDINTRDELKKELPDFYQFLSEILPQENQYKDCYYKD